MAERLHNFYPGPGAIPLPVLSRVQEEFFSYNGTRMSIMEISHRAKEVVELLADTTQRLKRLLSLDDDFEVLLLQGGGSLQFVMIPLNLSQEHDAVAYIDTGYWATKAINEAKSLGREVKIVASSEDANYTYIPYGVQRELDARFQHICSNNTIFGTQWADFPDVNVPLVADMSSDIMSRAIDFNRFGCIYAHAQKNIGPAGVAVVAIRKSLLAFHCGRLPAIIDYRVHVENASNCQTPPVFCIYVLNLVLDWIENEVGGLLAMDRINAEKAGLLYNLLDESDFYTCPVRNDSRSKMNVVFRLPSEKQEDLFCEESAKNEIIGL